MPDRIRNKGGPRHSEPTSAEADTEIERLPSPPNGTSRVDTLPDDFIATISRRPHMVGDVIASRYKLTALLSDGAMGQVFVAENLAIRRQVAVKVLKPESLADPSFRKRFQYDAEAISSIEHRNVVRFLDLIVGDPTFLVMEYVRGPTLAKVLRKERR
jgi:serine/threonine protein kinase